jgi:osmoprotectant transport system ATP-binding protein
MARTILFVTHDVEEAFKLGDQIAVLSDGELMQVGTAVELLGAPANDFVRRLVGADNVMRQLEYLPVTLAIEASAATDGAVLGADATMLQALLQLIQTGSSALTVEENGQALGRVTLSSIYRGLSAGRQREGEASPVASH